MGDRRTQRKIVVALVAVMVLLVAEGVVVTAVLVSPGAAEGVSRVVENVRETWEGTPDEPGVADRIGDAGKGVYRSWIEPLWTDGPSAKGSDDFARCVSCHPKYATSRRFSTVYMNHPVHAQLGVGCATCHTETAHPRPAIPDETTCQECHIEVTEEGGCSLCHAPASLPHFYFLGAPHEGTVRCETCHPRSVFTGTPNQRLVHVKFDGSQQATCLACHTPTTCKACHSVAHPANWVDRHDGLAWDSSSTCTECHTGTWCASRCHPLDSPEDYLPIPLPKPGDPIP